MPTWAFILLVIVAGLKSVQHDGNKKQHTAQRKLLLEAELQGQLNIARAASSEERVADANVRCHRNRQIPDAAASRSQSILRHIHRVVGPQWVGEVWMVQDIEEVGAELKPHRLLDLEGFGQRDVEIRVARAIEGVASKVA